MTEERLIALLKDALARGFAGDKRVAVPAGGALYWQWFCELSDARTWSMNGPNPISHGDIVAYRQLTGWPIAPHHIAVLRAMDDFWRKKVAGGNKSDVPGRIQQTSKRTMTPALFDALFG